MTSWTPILAPDRPRYLAVADAIRDDLAAGALKTGDRLPTHRDLAYRLGVTTGTVTRAYAEAERRGYLVGEVGRGSYVRQPARAAPPFASETSAAEPGIIDLTHSAPPNIQDPRQLDWALGQIMANGARADLLDYGPTGGFPQHRAMGAAWLARAGVVAPDSQVVVTAGAQGAVIAVLAALAQNGDKLFVEGLNYPTIKPIARHLGITLVPLESDDDGLVPDALERAARAGEASMLYIVPTLGNPTTATLTLERRNAVADIARRHGLTIIEDDIFRLLDRRVQPPPLQALAPERTYHITSLAKTMAPGLRVGFVAAPPGKADQLIRQQSSTSGRPVGLAAEIARHWIESGVADEILAANIAENAARRELALAHFRGRDFRCAPGAPYLWLKLPERWRPAEYAQAALAHGIRVTPGSAFAIDRRADDQAARLCFGGAPTRAELGQAFGRLNALLDEEPGEEFHSVA
jgi:DNA-binding transcriptional MocR family regulator